MLPINILQQCECALLVAEPIHQQASSTSGSHQRFNLHQGTCVCDMDMSISVGDCDRGSDLLPGVEVLRTHPPEQESPTYRLSIVGLHWGPILHVHCDATVVVD